MIQDTIIYEWEHKGCTRTFEILFEYTPGDPGVWRDADGSGYPATGPEIEFYDCRCLREQGDFDDYVPTGAFQAIACFVFEREIANDQGLYDTLYNLACEKVNGPLDSEITD